MTTHNDVFGSDRPLVETDWLEANLDEPDLRIADCTVFLTPDPAGGTRAESGLAKWQEAHIPGSAFADVLGALSDPDAEYRCTLPRADRFAEAMSALGVGEGTRVILYCAVGPAYATRVWWMLRAFGFDSAAILNGGLAKWTQEGRPLTDAPSSHPPAEFKVRERPELFVDKAHMVAALAAGDACIINALSKEQHTGSGGPNYGRPGRIPGTSCVPAMSLVDPETATYRPLAELRAAFAEVGALDAECVITYCGGGIAASSDAFTLNMLGVDRVSIYDGSLREWSADPDLPMATGLRRRVGAPRGDRTMDALQSTPSFADLMALRGGDPRQGTTVSFEGSDPVIQSRFKIGEVAAAVMAAGAVAADDIWRLRNGERRPQQIAVDQRAAAASLRSYMLIKVEDGPPLGTGWTLPTLGFYRCRDGRFLHLQGTFPHHRKGTLKFLECGDTVEEVGAKLARRDSFDWEEALAERRLCGAVIRSADEWMAHPQGKAISNVPLVEIIKISGGEPEPLPPASRPLGGVRVLDLTRVLAGPVSGRTMAAHGADVLHVRSPNLASVELFAADTNHGKFSTFLDLTRDEDAARLRELAREADIFVQGYRSGAMERRGFGVDALAGLRPGIIYVSLSCYGHTGPWAGRPGWEQLAQSVSGLAEEHGRPGDPKLVPAALCDNSTGYLAAFGAMMALRRRMQEGGSYHVRISLCRTAMWITSQARCPANKASEAAAVAAEDIDCRNAMTVSETPFGKLHHLDPIIRMSETPPHWVRTTVPLGTHEPQWPYEGAK